MLRKVMVGLIICIGLLESIIGIALLQKMQLPSPAPQTRTITHAQLQARLAEALGLDTLPMDVPETQLEKIPGYLLLTSVRANDGKIATSYIEDCSTTLWGKLEDSYNNIFNALPPQFVEMNNMDFCRLFIRTFVETSQGKKEITFDQVNKPSLSLQLIPQAEAGGGMLFKIPVSWSADNQAVHMKTFDDFMVDCPGETQAALDACKPYIPEWANYNIESGKLVGVAK